MYSFCWYNLFSWFIGAKTILENYYKKSVNLFETQLEKAELGKDLNKSFQLAQDIAEAYNNLGTFCDEQYTHILNYMNSKDFEDKKAILEQISEDVKMIKDQGMLSTFCLKTRFKRILVLWIRFIILINHF